MKRSLNRTRSAPCVCHSPNARNRARFPLSPKNWNVLWTSTGGGAPGRRCAAWTKKVCPFANSPTGRTPSRTWAGRRPQSQTRALERGSLRAGQKTGAREAGGSGRCRFSRTFPFIAHTTRPCPPGTRRRVGYSMLFPSGPMRMSSPKACWSSHAWAPWSVSPSVMIAPHHCTTCNQGPSR